MYPEGLEFGTGGYSWINPFSFLLVLPLKLFYFLLVPFVQPGFINSRL